MFSRSNHRTVAYVCRSCQRLVQSASRQRYSTTTSTTPEIYDVVTVGGGPVGLALLAALKSSPTTSHLRCALIEAQDLGKAHHWNLPSDQYSNRASSLTPTNVEFLDGIGAWKHVAQDRVQAYDEMQVWDAANDSSLRFDWRAEAIKYNAPPRTVATMTENTNLTRGLLRRLSELSAFDSLLSNTLVSSIKNGSDDPKGYDLSTWPVLTTKPNSNDSSDTAQPQQIAARLLIGADGFNSPVRSYAGIASHGWDYSRHGVVATLKLAPSEPTTFIDPSSLDSFLNDGEPTSANNRATAYQRFLPSLGGPIAILPLPDGHASLVWSTTPQIAQQLKSLSPAAFVATVNAALRLNQTDIKYMLSLPSTSVTSEETQDDSNPHSNELSWRLEHTPPHQSATPPTVTRVQPNTVASFPLRLRHATSLISPRVALAGDAAHTIHPLAGQGLNLGLADASSLAQTISYAVTHGMDIGDLMTLERYGSARFGQGLKMAMGVDGLNWLYQLGSADGLIGDGFLGSIISRVRGAGMSVLGASDVVKTAIMKQAD